MPAWAGLGAAGSVGNNDNPHIIGVPNDLENEFCAQQTRPPAELRTSQENLRDLVAPGKFDQRECGIITLEQPRFNVEIAREIQMAL